MGGAPPPCSPPPTAVKRVRVSYDEASDQPPEEGPPPAEEAGLGTGTKPGSGPGGGAQERRFRGQRQETPSHPGEPEDDDRQ